MIFLSLELCFPSYICNYKIHVNMKYIVSLVLIMASLWSCTDDFDPVNLTMTEVGKGDFSYESVDDENEYLIVTNSIHWNQLRVKANYGSITDTNVDFSQYTIIGCIDSVRSTGGYSIDIISVTEKEDEIDVKVEKSSSGAGAATLALTRPFHFVKVPKISKPVEFNDVD